MTYFKYIVFASLLVLTGAGCGLQQPEPIEETPQESASSQALKAENERLKKENEQLKKSSDKEEQVKDEKEEEESKDEMSTDETASDEELSTSGREIIGDLPNVDDLGDNRIDIFLVSEELGTGSESPTFKFGCDNYLYPLSINLEEGKSQSDLATAIVQLLTYKPSETEGQNVVRAKGFILANVTYEDGKRIVELEGEDITTAGVCEDARIKAQLEETIALYSDNYEIRLNGSAQDWDDLFNLGAE